MKIIYYTFFLIFSCISITEAQNTFEKTYGDEFFDEAKSVRQTTDGGYIIGGSNLIKTDNLGNVEWTQPYASSFANLTNDQGYILIYSNGNTIKFTKVASNGDIVWESYYSQGIWANDGNYIEQVDDGGYIVAGRYQDVTGSGMLLLKLDNQGNKLWQRTFNAPTAAGFSYGFSAHQTNDNGYIISGFTYIDYYESTSHTDLFIVKTDHEGTEEWRKYFGGTGNDAGTFMMQSNDDNYFITGRTKSYGIGDESNMYLIKLDSNGDSLWTQTFGGELEESATGLWATDDGGCIITGKSNSFTSGDFDGYIVKVDQDGNTIWTKNHGETGDEAIFSVQQTSDDGYIMAGYTNSIGAGGFDMLVLKTDALGNIDATSPINENLNSIIKCDLYPNPNNGIFSINAEKDVSRIDIFNVLGEIIYSANINASQARFNLNKNLKGIYFYQIYIGNNKVIKSGKVIIK